MGKRGKQRKKPKNLGSSEIDSPSTQKEKEAQKKLTKTIRTPKFWIDSFGADLMSYYLLCMNFVKLNKKHVSVKRLDTIVLECTCCNCHYFFNIESALEHISLASHKANMNLERLKQTCLYLIKSFPSAKIIGELARKYERLLKKSAMSDEEWNNRHDTVKTLGYYLNCNFSKEIALLAYGSSMHGLGATAEDDLNMFIKRNDGLQTPNMLNDVYQILKKEDKVSDIDFSFFANSQAVVFNYMKEGKLIFCNIRLYDPRAYALTTLFSRYSEFDGRVAELCLLVKMWAKVSFSGSEVKIWPGYAIYIIVISFLQDIKVLPIIRDPCSTDEFTKLKEQWINTNPESTTVLWMTLLKRLFVGQKLYSITENENPNWIKIAGQFFIEDPFKSTESNKENHQDFSTHSSINDYVHHCVRSSLLYHYIPQTKQGPIVGNILHIPKDNIIPGFNHFVCNEVNQMDNIILIIPYKDNSYLKPERYDLYEELKSQSLSKMMQEKNHMLYNMEELTEYISDNFERRLPALNKYQNLCVFPNGFHYLENALDPQMLDYKFSKSKLTNNEGFPKLCNNCGSKDHGSTSCPHTLFPPLPLDKDYDSELIIILNLLLDQVLVDTQPSEEKVNFNDEAEKYITELICYTYPDAHCESFGSSKNGFLSTSSDVDVCVTFVDNPDGKGLDAVAFLDQLSKDLKNSSYIKDVRCIAFAKVPIVKCTYLPNNIEVDVSIYNKLGPMNTKLLLCYSKIDLRLKKLVFMLKTVLTKNQLTTNRGCLTTYSLILMVIHFLQQVNPPVLPILQQIEPKIQILEDCNVYFYEDIDNLENVWIGMGKNTSSAGELWLHLLKYYTHTFDFNKYIVSIRQTELITKFSKGWQHQGLSIEDPFRTELNLSSRLSLIGNHQLICTLIRIFHQNTIKHYTLADIIAGKIKLGDAYLVDRMVQDSNTIKTTTKQRKQFLSDSNSGQIHCMTAHSQTSKHFEDQIRAWEYAKREIFVQKCNQSSDSAARQQYYMTPFQQSTSRKKRNPYRK